MPDLGSTSVSGLGSGSGRKFLIFGTPLWFGVGESWDTVLGRFRRREASEADDTVRDGGLV